MQEKHPPISPDAVRSILLKTIGITVGLTILAIGINYTYNIMVTGDAPHFNIARTVIITLLLSPPTLGALMLRNYQLAQAYAQINQIAATDQLTGALNRHGFVKKIEDFMKKRASTDNQNPVSFFALDVDLFKKVNDEHGHLAGDDALVLIAKAIKDNVRQNDVIGRMGGEEFGVFLPNTNSREAVRIAKRVKEAIAKLHFKPRGVRQNLSVSIGVNTTNGATSLSEIYGLADAKLYEAKTSGRNNVKASNNNDITPTTQKTNE